MNNFRDSANEFLVRKFEDLLLDLNKWKKQNKIPKREIRRETYILSHNRKA